jgi:hypothetical protein
MTSFDYDFHTIILFIILDTRLVWKKTHNTSIIISDTGTWCGKTHIIYSFIPSMQTVPTFSTLWYHRYQHSYGSQLLIHISRTPERIRVNLWRGSISYVSMRLQRDHQLASWPHLSMLETYSMDFSRAADISEQRYWWSHRHKRDLWIVRIKQKTEKCLWIKYLVESLQHITALN